VAAVGATAHRAKAVESGESPARGDAVDGAVVCGSSSIEGYAVELSIRCLGQAGAWLVPLAGGRIEIVEHGVGATGRDSKNHSRAVSAAIGRSAIEVPVAGLDQGAVRIISVGVGETVEHGNGARRGHPEDR